MWSEEYKDCLEYIDKYWERITYKPSKMQLRFSIKTIPYHFPLGNIHKNAAKKNANPHLIDIPYYYFVPNDQWLNYIFYWDSFFMFRGLMGTKRQWLMKEMVENFMYLYAMYDVIPNFNAPASMGRSQPPFLSSMILDTYLTPLNPANPHKTYTGLRRRWYEQTNRTFLKLAIKLAKHEYETVWIDKKGEYNHSVEGYMLSRYGDRDVGYAHSSELESGWDMTSRFYNQCSHFLPIDLNTYLYKYEKDFTKAALILNDKKESDFWKKKAEERKKNINDHMWNEEKGFFFDYNYYFKERSEFYSLASFTPLWAGFATYEQAKRMIMHLKKFETQYGLTITAKESLPKPINLSNIQKMYHPAINDIIGKKQWDYPNIWSPLEYLTVIGLLKYGFVQDATRIMKNSVKAHGAEFRKHGTFFEKLNGETGDSGSGAIYGDQDGFGWTNTTFYRYIQILDCLEKDDPIFMEPKTQEPPYELAILH